MPPVDHKLKDLYLTNQSVLLALLVCVCVCVCVCVLCVYTHTLGIMTTTSLDVPCYLYLHLISPYSFYACVTHSMGDMTLTGEKA